MTGAIVGGLAGMVAGGVYGAYTTGTVRGTLAYAAGGLVIGAALGAIAGAGVYYAPAIARVIVQGWTQHARVFRHFRSDFLGRLGVSHSRSELIAIVGFLAGLPVGYAQEPIALPVSAGALAVLFETGVIGQMISHWSETIAGTSLAVRLGITASLLEFIGIYGMRTAAFWGGHGALGFMAGYLVGYNIRAGVELLDS